MVRPCSVCMVREEHEIDGTSGQCRTCGVLVCRRCTDDRLPLNCPACGHEYVIDRGEACLNMLGLITKAKLNPEAVPKTHLMYAHNFLAGALLNGDGLTADPARAFSAFHKAAELGHAPSIYTVGRNRIVLGKEVELGYDCIRHAADCGYAPAAVYAYRLYVDLGADKRPYTVVEVQKWLSGETCQANPTAIVCLGALLEETAPIELSFSSIISLFGAAASMGHKQGKARLEELESQALSYGDTLLRRFATHAKKRLAAEGTST